MISPVCSFKISFKRNEFDDFISDSVIICIGIGSVEDFLEVLVAVKKTGSKTSVEIESEGTRAPFA